jgi:hypothetical protein
VRHRSESLIAATKPFHLNKLAIALVMFVSFRVSQMRLRSFGGVTCDLWLHYRPQNGSASLE